MSSIEPPSNDEDAPRATGWRFRLGLFILVVGFVSPAFAALLPLLDLPTAAKATLTGFLVFGIPELLTVVAIAIMGKPGFLYVKGRLFRLLKRHGPPEVVGPTRHRIGLAMFLLPLAYGWAMGYWPDALSALTGHRMAVSVAFDIMFIISVFVLGGQFWDKVRALFVREAYAVQPQA